MKFSIVVLIILLFHYSIFGQIITGAEKTKEYMPFLLNKKVAFTGNHTSVINKIHIADSLISLNINIIKIFTPEHGFRGNLDAGKKVNNEIDTRTGLPIISLYGNNKKPQSTQLKDIDIMVFDIQDVGVRFYTYISTLHFIMEACAENNIPVIVLDRPNPNGHYIDGPVLDTAFRSFVGMHPVPVVYGMTIGEYALMINGEGWLKNKIKCNLTVIPCENYTHNLHYELPIKPSPNLPNARAINLYPTLCFFEGTPLSIGRGTQMQFQVIGHPLLKDKNNNFNFTPISQIGANNPPLKNQICYGLDLRDSTRQNKLNEIDLKTLINIYHLFPNKEIFFLKNNFFDKLAGNSSLRNDIIMGKSEKEIRNSWQDDLKIFKDIRKKYLLYSDL